MTYRKEVEKTVKSYFSQSGYKYYPKKGFFVTSLSTDIIRSIGFAFENHGKSRYYFLRTFVSVCLALKNLDSKTQGYVKKNDINKANATLQLSDSRVIKTSNC